MKLTSRGLGAALLALLSACASPLSEDGDGSGGTSNDDDGSGTGGGLIGTGGGLIGAGGGTGGAGTGGAGTGGSATGGVNTGGSATGGTASGGAGAGGSPVYEGDCEDKPTYDEWKTGGALGDQVIYVCTALQGACAGLMLSTSYLFECTGDHLPNCQGQKPQDSSVWAYVTECTEE